MLLSLSNPDRLLRAALWLATLLHYGVASQIPNLKG
jgi:hypothetical protein